MAEEYIFVKVGLIGKCVCEVPLSPGASVQDALVAAKKFPIPRNHEMRRNNTGTACTVEDKVSNGDIILLIPQIRGGY